MSTRPPAPDYSGRDYTSALTRIQRLIQSIFPKWTDFNKANFGNMMIRCMAFIVDILSKYTDFMALESLPEHAKLRKSVQAHSRWIGYKLSGRKAAQATLTFTLADGVHTQDVTIPSGTIVRVADPINPIEFQTLSEVTITAGDTQVTVEAEHSEEFSDLETSTGGVNQIFKLTRSPYIEDTISVVADDGTYTLADNFLESSSSDKHFTAEINDEEKVCVRFGNGINGKIPEGEIEFIYKVNGGLEGNVESGTLIDLVDSLTDALGDGIAVDVTNDDPASGGDDPETLERAKQQAPAELRVLNRTIAREDYEIGARDVAGVATALALTSDDSLLIREAEVVVWVLEKGQELSNGSFRPQHPSSATLRAVEEYYRETKPKPLGIYVRAAGDAGTILKDINVYATVSLDNTASKAIQVSGQPTEIGLAIFTALEEFFAVIESDGSLTNNVDFGFNVKKQDGSPNPKLSWSKVFRIIEGVSGVDSIDCGNLLLNGSSENVSLRLWEFPNLGTVTIIEAETGEQLYPAV